MNLIQFKKLFLNLKGKEIVKSKRPINIGFLKMVNKKWWIRRNCRDSKMEMMTKEKMIILNKNRFIKNLFRDLKDYIKRTMNNYWVPKIKRDKIHKRWYQVTTVHITKCLKTTDVGKDQNMKISKLHWNNMAKIGLKWVRLWKPGQLNKSEAMLKNTSNR